MATIDEHVASVEGGRLELLGLPKPELAERLAPFIDRPYRVEQIYRAMYHRGVTQLDAITELSKELRGQLANAFSLTMPEVEKRQVSADGTIKYLFRLADQATIETVDIPDGRRRTLCLSSQAGCALACRFCVTGYWGGGRNLSSGEIVAQVLAAQEQQGGDLRLDGLNLVFMGMGEPLLNLQAVEAALQILTETISRRRITVSTAGVIPGIKAMARWSIRPRLAISLHAPDDRRRSSIMPINQKYPLPDLMRALRGYPTEPREKITFEYLLIDGFNDSPSDAEAVAKLVRGLPAKVNLIPLNPDAVLDPEMKPPQPGRVEAFRRRLLSRGLIATVRKQRGDDVSAACGQLRAPDRDPRGFRRSNLRF
ncbi:MAG: 23S rRNA (adenine(2503)-C(2))-methyltransferase RlmN [Acidobacteriota bacterium]